jgi:hypothetical protein
LDRPLLTRAENDSRGQGFTSQCAEWGLSQFRHLRLRELPRKLKKCEPMYAYCVLEKRQPVARNYN